MQSKKTEEKKGESLESIERIILLLLHTSSVQQRHETRLYVDWNSITTI